VRASTIVMICFAVLFGLLAVFIAQAWLNSQAEMRMKSLEAQKTTPVATKNIVVAAKPLRYGMQLSADLLREIPWSQDAVPKGAFTSISEILSGGKRVVLAPIEANEPVLSLKVTGAGQRATLSSLVENGMKAVTIRVNDVEGVGGFVLPGDRVDVVLTRTEKDKASTEIVLQNARVLAVDQSADVSSDKPAVAKAVTLEVSTGQAQRVWLASSVGSLSLLLRKAGETNAESTKRITLSDLDGQAAATDTKRVIVTRGLTKQEYSVPVEGTEASKGFGLF
jgi:pilus assembly protein CpaB